LVKQSKLKHKELDVNQELTPSIVIVSYKKPKSGLPSKSYPKEALTIIARPELPNNDHVKLT